MNILKNNKLIAEFMGAKEFEENGWFLLPCKISEETPDGFESSKADLVFYHESWDWLIPVVEKIENKFCSSNIHYYSAGKMKQQHVVEFLGYSAEFSIVTYNKNKLKAVYEAVIEFIKWYNENNKSN